MRHLVDRGLGPVEAHVDELFDVVVRQRVLRTGSGRILAAVGPVLESVGLARLPRNHRTAVVENHAVKARVPVEVGIRGVVGVLGRLADRIAVGHAESIDQLLRGTHRAVALKAARIEGAFHVVVRGFVARGVDDFGVVGVAPIDLPSDGEASGDVVHRHLEIHHLLGAFGGLAPALHVAVGIEPRAGPREVDQRLDGHGADAVETAPVLGPQHAAVVGVRHQEVAVRDRQILVGRIAVAQDLRHALVVGVALEAQAAHLLGRHLPDTHGFEQDGIPQQAAVRAASAELLQQVPLEPGAQGVGFAPEAVAEQLVEVLVEHIAHVQAAVVLEEHVDVVDALVVAVPVGFERVVRGARDADGETPQDIGRRGAHGVVRGAVEVGALVVVVVLGHVVVALADEALHRRRVGQDVLLRADRAGIGIEEIAARTHRTDCGHSQYLK